MSRFARGLNLLQKCSFMSYSCATMAVRSPSMAPTVQFARATAIFNRSYSSAHPLDPANKSDYDAYVDQWMKHFATVEDDFELERGLNHIFAADWVPSVELIAEAIKASRRLNTFATAVRILEGLEEKSYKKEQYQAYIKELKPLLEELGVPERSELGKFLTISSRTAFTE